MPDIKDTSYLGLTQEDWSSYYAFIAGQLVHNPNRPDHTFTTEKHRKRFYKNYAGKLTSCTPDRHGYALIRALHNGHRVVGYRHKVVWFLTHGWLPPTGFKILHLDGDKLNDLACNLGMYETANPTPKLIIPAITGRKP